jgi:hypothetical protein
MMKIEKEGYSREQTQILRRRMKKETISVKRFRFIR